MHMKITDKGNALLAAIEAGVIPETEEGFNTFDKFWGIYKEKVDAVSRRMPDCFLPLISGIIGALVGGTVSFLLTITITPLLM